MLKNFVSQKLEKFQQFFGSGSSGTEAKNLKSYYVDVAMGQKIPGTKKPIG